MNDKHHEMVLERTHVSGVEEWYCPSCGRRFLVQLIPWIQWMEKVNFDSMWNKYAQ